jgi:hypothetical protein
MPVSYRIDKRNGLVVIKATGVLTRSEFAETRRRLMSDPDFDPRFSQLADCTRVTRVTITAGEIRALADTSAFNLDARRAIVAKSDPVFGLARMFVTVRGLRGDEGIRVFRDRDQALVWLFKKDEAA